MKKGYQVREIHTREEEPKYKRIRVYDSLQHIWNVVHFKVSPANARLAGTWYNENGARVIFEEYK